MTQQPEQRGEDDAAKARKREASYHVSLFIPSDDPEVSTHGAMVINTESVRLTRERMELLRLVGLKDGVARRGTLPWRGRTLWLPHPSSWKPRTDGAPYIAR